MQVLNREQVGQFLKTARACPTYALYHLALVTGMRMGELLGLNWSDIDWESGLISVQRQRQYVPGVGCSLVEPKTRCGIRTIKVGETSLSILRSHKRVNEEKKKKAKPSMDWYGPCFPEFSWKTWWPQQHQDGVQSDPWECGNSKNSFSWSETHGCYHLP